MITRYFLPLTSLITATSITSLAAADSVTLKNGNILSGKLTDSDTSGILTLTYPDAKQPLKIRETAVEQILFDSSGRASSNLTQSIQLLNGDYFPCTITELNDKTVTFNSDSVGNHTITRDKVSKIKFNTKANKILYSGPGDDLSAWTSSSEDWKLRDGNLTTIKRSEIAKKIPALTENYILEFKTTWDETSPVFKICFSSDNSQADRKSDYYHIDINTHGITINRNNKGNSNTYTQLLADDSMYGQSSLHVAIHVDRKNQKMALYLNGNLVKTIKDTNKTTPKGKYIVFKNLQRTGVQTRISDIKVSSWNGKVPDDIKSKADALTRHDLITDRSGNVMTGQIIGITQAEGKTNLNFKPPFAKTDSNIPGSALDVLEFKTVKGVPMLSKPVYYLKLVSGGVVSFSSSQMAAGKLNVEHPFLGKISLPITSLSSVRSIPELPAKDEDENKNDNAK